VNSQQIFWFIASAFGLWLAVHCPRAAMRQLQSGIARGLDATASEERSYERSSQPIGFWSTIGATFLAGAMGLLFVLYGITMIFGGEA
jgi:hypothetical protein